MPHHRMNHEIRQAVVPELRAGGGELPTLEGYAAVFGEPSEPIGGMFLEYVDPGAFSRTLAAGADVRALVDHDPSKILGRSTSGTLKLTEDSHGLLATIRPPDTTVGRDIAESVRRGDVSQMSFAFSVVGQEWEEPEGSALPRRHLTDVDLHDVSVVTYPAYTGTAIAARTLEEYAHAMKERRLVAIRRELRAQATVLAARLEVGASRV